MKLVAFNLSRNINRYSLRHDDWSLIQPYGKPLVAIELSVDSISSELDKQDIIEILMEENRNQGYLDG